MKPEPIRCSCGALFGYADVSDGNKKLAIKHRDLYRIIVGSVEGPCRKCGALVSWPPEPLTIKKV